MSLLTPQHIRTTWVLPAGVLTNLDFSGSFGPQTGEPLPKAACDPAGESVETIFVKTGLLVEPGPVT